MIELAIIISVATAISFAAFTRGSGTAMIWGMKQGRALFIKKILKKKLKKSMKKCSYNDFSNVIYDIKNFDIQYDKSLFNSIKLKYNMSDDNINSRSYFNNRFSLDKNKNNIYDILDYIDKKYDELKKK